MPSDELCCDASTDTYRCKSALRLAFFRPASGPASQERRTAVFAGLKCCPARDHLGRVINQRGLRILWTQMQRSPVRLEGNADGEMAKSYVSLKSTAGIAVRKNRLNILCCIDLVLQGFVN